MTFIASMTSGGSGLFIQKRAGGVGFAGTEGDEEKATATAKAEIDAWLGKLESPRADEPPVIYGRRFPPPWTVAEQPACFVVLDDTGQKLAYIYYEDEPGRRAATKLLSKHEARRIAANIVKLPGVLGVYDASASSRTDK